MRTPWRTCFIASRACSACRAFPPTCAPCAGRRAPEAAEAIALYVYRIVREVGSLAAALGGLDGLVFTAGIGENDPATRAEVAADCGWLGVKLDTARNAVGDGPISSPGAAVPVWVVPTDEERMIARYTGRMLATA